ncbi:dihydrofolate reductase [Candidatus Daviesbacteria bacterium]|nr:dihydrofolate reductase [Candidatus Daviesbacteria bacterium]
MIKPKISIIVAVAGEKRVIGKKGGMPWYIPGELKRFREITNGHPIIMGRKTYESIGKALPDRTNIVITTSSNYTAIGCVVVHSLQEALQQARGKEGSEEVFIIGGGEVYKQALSKADKLYITEIQAEIEGDTVFPDYSEFKKVVWESEEFESKGFKYKFLELER